MAEQNSSFIYIAFVLVNLLAMNAGMNFTWSSPVLPKLVDKNHLEDNPLGRPLTTSEKSWITSLLILGATSCITLPGWLANKIGRKTTLLIFAVPSIIGNIIIMFSTEIWHFYLGRFLAGITTGATNGLMPVIFSEISQVEQRGVLGTLLSVLGSFSQIVVFVVGPYVSIKVLGIIITAPAIAFVFLTWFFVPETPYYLVIKNKIGEAENSLKKYRGRNDVTEDLKEIISTIEAQGEQAGLIDIVRDKVARKTVSLCVWLMIFEQITGVQGITSYLQPIFEATGSSIPSDISAMVYGVLAFLATILTTFLVEKFNRRTLLIVSQVGIIVCLFFIGLFFLFKNKHYDLGSFFWVPIASIVGFNVSFNLGSGPIVMVVIGEVLPPKIKSITANLVMFVRLCLTFVVMFLFPYLQEYLGDAGAIWSFAVCTIVGLIYTYIAVPETRGKSLAEIQEGFKRSVEKSI